LLSQKMFCTLARFVVIAVTLGGITVNAASVSANAAQTFTGIGGSGAWWPIDLYNFPEEVRQNVSTLLFSQSGLGLSSYRYNIGGGGVNVANQARAPETFYVGAGQYDWNKDPQGKYFLNEASKRGVGSLTAFVNSAPAPLTSTKGSCAGAYVSGKDIFLYTLRLLCSFEHSRVSGCVRKLFGRRNRPFQGSRHKDKLCIPYERARQCIRSYTMRTRRNACST
jgi:hypothetical protein